MGSKYSVNKNIGFKSPILRSDLRDCNAYIVVKGTKYLLPVAANKNDKAERDVVFKNNAPFRSCILKINNRLVDNADHKNYKFRIIAQPKNNNFDYMIDPAFKNINRFFALSFKYGDNDSKRNYFGKYYMPFAEIKILMLINNIPFFDQPLKNKLKVYEKLLTCQEK